MKRSIEIYKMDMKYIWWNWFLANRKYWPYGLTYAKLIKHIPGIWQDSDIWYDLLNRHSMIEKFPWNAEREEKENYDHAIGNFSGNIAARILR